MNGITPEAREEAREAILTGFHPPRNGEGTWKLTPDESIDALVAAGWGPVSAPVRPTVEALTAEMKAAEEAETTFNHTWTYHRKIAERLLAADHLWTEPAAEVEYGEGLLVDDSPDRYVLHRGPWVEPRALDEGYVLMQRTVGPWVPSGSVPTETEGEKA